MSTIPTTPPPPPPAHPPTSGAPVVVVSNPPPALATAAVGARLEGLLLAQLAQGATPQAGQLSVQTPLGTLSLQSSLLLPQGAVLGLVVQSLNPVKVQIASINGQPTQQALRQGVAKVATGGGDVGKTPGGAVPASAAGGKPTVNLTTGSLTVATLLRQPSAVIGQSANAKAHAHPAIPHAKSASAKLTSAKPMIGSTPPPPPGAPQRSQTTPSPGSAKPPTADIPTATTTGKKAATVSQAGGAVKTTSTKATFPKTGSTLPVRITTVQPPRADGVAHQTPAAAPQTLTTGSTLQGVVVRTTPLGQPVLTTAVGDVSLALTDRLPVGSRVILTATASLSPPVAANAAVAPSAMIRSGDWPALRDAADFLGLTDPAQAQHLLSKTLARPNGQLASAMFFFLTSLRGGDIRSWLNAQTVRVLEKGKSALMNRLSDDFRGFKRTADAAQSGDWRSYLIPFHAEQQIQPIRLYVRADDENDDEDGKSAGTRFLVDLTLTRLGRLQVDGLVNMDNRHMDMILRSEAPLPNAMRADLLSMYTNAADVTGMHGGLSFQATPDQFITVTPTDRVDAVPGGPPSGVLV